MSRRMNCFKPLLRLGNRSMIEVTVDRMLAAGIHQVVVVTGYRAEEVKRVLQTDQKREKRIRFAYNPDYATSQMLESVKIGLAQMSDCESFFLALGDMPAISVQTYKKILNFEKQPSTKVVFPIIDGYRKHPPLISARCIRDIYHFQEEGGLRMLWKYYEGMIQEVPLQDIGCTIDVDVPADYKRICSFSWG